MTKRLFVHTMLAVLLTTTSCGLSDNTGSLPSSQKPPTMATGNAPRVDPTINYADPAAVCEAFAAIINRIDTTKDTNAGDAYFRARPYLTYEQYAALTKQPTTRSSPLWETWKQHRAATEVELHPFAGDGPAGETQRVHSVLIGVTPTGRDGWQGQTTYHAVHCGLNIQDGQWRIATYDIEDLNP